MSDMVEKNEEEVERTIEGLHKTLSILFFLIQITYKHTQGGDSHENQIKDPLAKVGIMKQKKDWGK